MTQITFMMRTAVMSTYGQITYRYHVRPPLLLMALDSKKVKILVTRFIVIMLRTTLGFHAVRVKI